MHSVGMTIIQMFCAVQLPVGLGPSPRGHRKCDSGDGDTKTPQIREVLCFSCCGWSRWWFNMAYHWLLVNINRKNGPSEFTCKKKHVQMLLATICCCCSFREFRYKQVVLDYIWFWCPPRSQRQRICCQAMPSNINSKEIKSMEFWMLLNWRDTFTTSGSARQFRFDFFLQTLDWAQEHDRNETFWCFLHLQKHSGSVWIPWTRLSPVTSWLFRFSKTAWRNVSWRLMPLGPKAGTSAISRAAKLHLHSHKSWFKMYLQLTIKPRSIRIRDENLE